MKKLSKQLFLDMVATSGIVKYSSINLKKEDVASNYHTFNSRPERIEVGISFL